MIAYRKEIDGLRAVAILPVLAFHLGQDWLPGGYLGVDVFFVISGFLITSIIENELRSGKFTFIGFWERRCRRILPALGAMIGVTMLMSAAFSFGPTISSHASDGIAACLSYGNIAMWRKVGDYWGMAAENSPFLHTWSLSVEEQFYVLYPLFLFFLLKYKINRVAAITLVGAISLILFCIYSSRNPNACFYLLPTRAWELACGGCIAIISREKTLNHGAKNLLSAMGLLMILVSFFTISGVNGISFYTVLPVAGACLVILYGKSGPVKQVLSIPALAFIGRISYSMYLWHWPVIVLGRNHIETIAPNHPTLFTVLIIAAFTLTSYFLIEKPTRRMRKAAWVAIPIAASSLMLCFHHAFEKKIKLYETSYLKQTEFYGLYYDLTPNPAHDSPASHRKREGVKAPGRDPSYAEAYLGNGIQKMSNAITPHPEIVILGDSHGAMWAKTIEEMADKLGFTPTFFTTVGYAPVFDPSLSGETLPTFGFSAEQMFKYRKNLVEKMKIWNPSLVILCCRWENFKEVDFKTLEVMMTWLSQHSKNLILIGQPPVIPIGDNNATQYLAYLGHARSTTDEVRLDMGENQLRSQHAIHDRLKRITSRFGNCGFYDPLPEFLRGTETIVMMNSHVLYYDDDHLSQHGTLACRKSLEKIVLDALE